jgi:hypothetical protein
MSLERSSEQVEFDGVVEFRQDGSFSTHYYEIAEGARFRVRGGAAVMQVVRRGVAEVPAPRPSAAQRRLSIAARNGDAADLLTFIGRADNWFDLYKAVEMLGVLRGGEHKLMKLPEARAVNLKAIKQTASFARHAKARSPAQHVTFKDAREGVLSVARSVLA